MTLHYLDPTREPRECPCQRYPKGRELRPILGWYRQQYPDCHLEVRHHGWYGHVLWSVGGCAHTGHESMPHDRIADILKQYREVNPCTDCHGTGRLGDPDAVCVEIERGNVMDEVWRPAPAGDFWWRIPWESQTPTPNQGDAFWRGRHGPFPTREAALEAAREAHRNG